MIAFCAIIIVSCQKTSSKADRLRLNNEFYEAAALYQKAADAGDAYAMWRLSNAYSQGDGVEYDEKKALEWLQKSAEKGCEEAKCDLAFAYMYDWYNIGEDKIKGKEMMDALVKKTDNSFVNARYAYLLFYCRDPYEENKEKALTILEKVKDKSNNYYLWMMANVYSDGAGTIERDMDKAVSYYEMAFDEGRRYSAYNLYRIFSSGYGGLEVNDSIAIEWLKKGVKSNVEDCMCALSDIYLSEDIRYESYHNPARGIELLRNAIRHGSGPAFCRLGVLHYEGKYVDKDDTLFFEYCKKASGLKDAGGTHNLAFCYIDGVGCEKDEEKGWNTYKMAVKYGSGDAAYKLYIHYLIKAMYPDINASYDSVTNDYSEAKKYLLESARLGSVIGCYELGRQYYNGNGVVKQNYQLALNFMKQAADAGHIDACNAVSYFYEQGIGCDKNLDLAQEYKDKTLTKKEKKEKKKSLKLL